MVDSGGLHLETLDERGRLAAYLSAHLANFHGPMTLEKFPGGQSNPTFRIRSGSGIHVLRRQPPGELLKSAHAVDREYRVLSALAGTAVPVPRVFHLCEDRSVIGSMFYVMSFEEGRIFWDPALPEVAPEDRAAFYFGVIDAMAALHNVDPASVGLADFGRSGGYFERQIAVWTKQYRAAETDRIEAIEALMRWLPENRPAGDFECRLVHGDFRLDNLVFHAGSPRVKAILDWELSTLGDPLADLAYFCMCLRLPADGYIPGLAGQDRGQLGIPGEQAIVSRYCQLRGIAGIPNWHFFIAFSFFRLASIAQGVKRRSLLGNASSSEAVRVGAMVAPLAELAVALIGAAG